MKKQHIITIVCIFSFILQNSQLCYTNINCYNKQNNALRTLLSESSLHEFITIEYDKNFTDYGFPGNGTQDNPYRIENYSLDEIEYLNGIVIINTTKHFLIQNCYLMAFWSAIYIENVSDGTAVIRENTLLQSEVGIAVKDSNGVQIINNICGPYNNFGIFLSTTSNSIAKQNTCYQNIDYAIFSVESVSNYYWNNNCSYNFNAGMVLYEETNASIINNICNYNLRGGFFEVTNSTIKGNIFDNNYCYGCIFTKTGFSTISYNLFCYNTEYGCFVEDVDNCGFIGNYFANNSLYGLLLNKYSSNN